jgi:signal transduction histidine kinase
MALSHPIGDPGTSIMALGVCLILAIGLLLARFRRSQGLERQQYKWVVLNLALVVVAFVADFAARGSGSGWYVVTNPLMSMSIAMVPVAMTVAILRYRLWDIDVVISRTLVYLALSASVVGIYIFIVGWLGTRFHTGGNLFFSLLATGVVAVLFQPLRERIQRGVNHLLFGERDEPYAVVSRLGRRLDESFAPGAVLPAIAATVREALKLPYTAVVLWNGADQPLEVASGEPVPNPLRLPLVYQQEAVGELLLAPRAQGESFNQADQRLLDDLARQAGIALHAVRLNHDLQQARERLVDAREEERRRLRRDLHDGLGSQLAALYLQWNALRVLIDTYPASAQREVVELRGQLQAAIASVRGLVHGLRPPAIDELGLLVALRERIRRFESPDLLVEISLPETVPELPAAVEVAVYRIVEEALTNVTTHAHATWCAARLSLSETLAVMVEDNGAGICDGFRSGVGLQSMRERAEELGGNCRVEARPGGGTRVAIQLPIGRTSRHGL